MKLKRSFYNLFFNILSQIVTFSLGIILPRLFLTNLGSEVNGLVSSVGQVFACVGLLEAGIGVTTIQALYKPISQNDKIEINRILAASQKDYIRIGSIYTVCVAGVAVLYPFIVQSEISRWQVVAVVLFTGIGNAINFLLQQNYVVLLSAEGKGYVITNLNLIVNILVNITKAILLMQGHDIVVVTASQLIITLLRIILLRVYLKKEYDWLDFSVEPNYEALSKRKYVLVQQLSYFVYSNTDIIILTAFCDLKVVSVYTIYNLVIGMIEGVISAFSSSVVFALGLLYNEDKSRFKKIFEIFDAGYMTLVFACFTVTYIAMLPFLQLYTKGISDINYLDEKLAFLFVFLKMIATLRSQSQNAINFAGHFKETQKSAVGEMMINLIVTIVGVITIGIYGALFGSIVATMYRGIFVTNYVNKNILKNSKKECKKKYLHWSINLGLFAIISFIGKQVVVSVENYIQLIEIMIPCTILTMLIYFGVLLIEKPMFVKEICGFIKGKFRGRG